MRLRGIQIEPPQPKSVVFIREKDGAEIGFEFKVAPVLSFDVFDKLVPPPQPVMVSKPGEPAVPDPKDPRSIKREYDYQALRWDWWVITSLRATEGLEWEKVDYDKPDTWTLWEQELLESGLLKREINELQNAVLEVNQADEKRLKEARDRFAQAQAGRKHS